MREQTLGEYLRETRVQRKITLDDIESQTDISSHYLLALELDQFKIIPEEKFDSILKSYASIVGLDFSLLKNRYQDQTRSGRLNNENSVTRQVEEKLYQRRQNDQFVKVSSVQSNSTTKSQLFSNNTAIPTPAPQPKVRSNKEKMESLISNDKDKKKVSRLSRYKDENKKSKSILSILLLGLLALAVFSFIFLAVWKQFSNENRVGKITSIFMKKDSKSSEKKAITKPSTAQSFSKKQTVITSQGHDNFLNATVTKAKETVDVTVTLTDAESRWFSLTNSDLGEAGTTLTKENPTYTATLPAEVTESLLTLGTPHGIEIKIDNQLLDLTSLPSSDVSYITLTIQK